MGSLCFNRIRRKDQEEESKEQKAETTNEIMFH